MLLSGSLTDWSVSDLLQMIHVTKKTVSLHVAGSDRSGVVHFESGEIVNAHVSLGLGPISDPKGQTLESVYVLQLVEDGTFEMKHDVASERIEPVTVADALDYSSHSLAAERALEQTGLLAARGLRLAPSIDDPITLSEQVWGAISVSIPAFTFLELESRLGRAAAVDTIEQFRELGILEAVLDDPDAEVFTASVSSISGDLADEVTPDSDGAKHHESGSEHEWEPPVGQSAVDAPFAIPDLPEIETTGWAPDPSYVGLASGAVEVTEEPMETIDPIFAVHSEEPSIIVVASPPEDIVIDDEMLPTSEWSPSHAASWDEPVSEDADASTDHAPEESLGAGSLTPSTHPTAGDAEPSPGPTAASSLSAAIRAAAKAGGAVEVNGSVDDETQLLSEAATRERTDRSSEDGTIRRTVRSLVAPQETTLVSGIIGDLGARFRQAASDTTED